jgi:hypothetical protein
MGNYREEIMRKDNIECGSCEYFDMVDQVNGKCRRNAPSPTVIKGSDKGPFQLVLPLTKIHDWCGEFKYTDIRKLRGEIIEKKIVNRGANA